MSTTTAEAELEDDGARVQVTLDAILHRLDVVLARNGPALRAIVRDQPERALDRFAG